MVKNILQLTNVSFNYYGGYEGCNYLNCSVIQNQTICVYGNDDSGKTSMLRAIAGVEAYQGSILLEGKELRDIPSKERGIGMTFHRLPKRGKVIDAIAYPLKIRKVSKSDIQSRVYEIAEKLNITHLLRFSISMLTKPQAIMVELARLMVVKRKLYLIDNLLEDIYITQRRELMAEIIPLLRTLDATVIITTDLIDEVGAIDPDQLILLAYNRMCDIGLLHEMAKRPKEIAIVKLLDIHPNIIKATVCGKRIAIGEITLSMTQTIGEKFKEVLLYIPRQNISIVSGDKDYKSSRFSLDGIVTSRVQQLTCNIISLNTDIGNLFISVLPNQNISIGQAIAVSIDIEDALIYDNYSERIISGL